MRHPWLSIVVIFTALYAPVAAAQPPWPVSLQAEVTRELRIIDPYTRKEITGYKGLCPGSFRHKFLPKGKRYETPLTSPSK